MRGVGATAFSLALLATVLHAFALGGALGALREPSSSLVTFGREGMRRMPAFLVFTFAAFGAAFAAYQWIYVALGRSAARPRPGPPHRAGGAGRDGRCACWRCCSRSRSSSCSPTPCAPSGSRGRTCRPVSRFLFGIGGAIGRPLRLFGILGLYAVSTAGALRHLARPRSVRRRRGALRARAADPDAAGLRLRAPPDQDRLLRRHLRGADARAASPSTPTWPGTPAPDAPARRRASAPAAANEAPLDGA